MAGRLDRLNLYVEQLGFLHAGIESENASGARTEAPPRIETYTKAGMKPPLPDLPTSGDYLVSAMFSLRPTRPMPMGGVRPADWPEIWPFMQATGTITEAWEAEAMHRMCAAYCDGLNAGKKPLGISPMERDA